MSTGYAARKSSPLACLSHSSGVLPDALGITQAAATRLFGKQQSEDLPSSITLRFLAFCCCLVFAQHKPKEGRQGSPLLQHRGEPADLREQDGAAYRAVSWRKTLAVLDEEKQHTLTWSWQPCGPINM